MEIKGRIVQILEPMGGISKSTGKEWKKQEYILETNDSQYPRKICFNLWGDTIDRANLQMNEEVTVQVDIESREFNGRWYTDVKGWRVDRGIEQPPMGQPVGYQQQPMGGYATAPSNATVMQQPASGLAGAAQQGAGDDLPF